MDFSTTLPARAASYLNSEGLFEFFLAGIDYTIPEPYATYIESRLVVLGKAVSPGPHSIKERVNGVRYGLPPTTLTLYCRRGDFVPERYLSEVARRDAKHINKRPDILDDKVRFYRYLEEHGFGAYVPELYGHIDRGRFRADRFSEPDEILKEQDRLVVKKVTGGGGNEVWVCATPEELDSVLQSIDANDRYLVQEHCSHGPYLSHVYDGTTNTIRLLTLRTDQSEVLLPAAAQRIGSNHTDDIDNFSQGGLAALIDMDTGELGPGVRLQDGHTRTWFHKHPDTEGQISGVKVPGWDVIKEDIRGIVRECDAFRYVGWDLVVTAPGEFKILEGNSYPNPRMIQAHTPLLSNPEVKKFFDHHDVL